MTKCWEREGARRHRFAWFASEAKFFDTAPEGVRLEDWLILREWIGQGRPLIVRRPCVSEDGKLIHVGLALPPVAGKRRLAYSLPMAAMERLADPPLWEACRGGAAAEVDAAAQVIQAAATAAGLPLQAFGSHAWQHHTGLPYVTPTSDMDLLAPIQRRESWEKFRDAMARAGEISPRADLEIILRDDASFNWREYAAPGSRMLYKGNASVWLGDKSNVEELLGE